MGHEDDYQHIQELLRDTDAFSREDETDDSVYYARDRFVSHLDSLALATVETVIGTLVIDEKPAILDLMAGCESHIPASIEPREVVGLGLNQNELTRNPALTETICHDLNKDPELPFEDGRFDAVLNTVSVDYMTRPFEVFGEVGRVVRPGGLFLVIFSNRMFPAKAVKIWQEATEPERIVLVQEYFRVSGMFGRTESYVSRNRPRPKDDPYAHLGIPSDPVYAVYADRIGAPSRPRPRPGAPAEHEPAPAGESAGPEKASTGPREASTGPEKASTGPREASTGPEKASTGPEKASTGPECPHCGERMKKWSVPESPFPAWDVEYIYICFNDSCPYLVRGWEVMTSQGNPGFSYRQMYHPKNGSFMPIPIPSLKALREYIVEE